MSAALLAAVLILLVFIALVALVDNGEPCQVCHGYGMIVSEDDFEVSGFAGPQGPPCAACQGTGRAK